ncbi:uncharacterized protein [Henckelia pumila]|uniref:uncharacterized protein n=1 Tax=Henckelia pumila TaxID=405737 RepID=UPI003C6DFE51
MELNRERQRDFPTLLKAVKHEGTIELRVINSKDVCRHCGAKKFEFESPTFCCDNGKIILADTAMPHELFELFTNTQSQEAENFRKRIRVYNSLFSFTSFGVKVDNNLAFSKCGIYTFRVLGQVFHTLPPLNPHEGKPSHFQLYFWDNDNELDNRMNVFDNADVYEVDMYINLETTRLDYYRNNQAELRAEYYQRIVDNINCGQNRRSEIGKRIVLPASFIGGPRDMRIRYLDAMALRGLPHIHMLVILKKEHKINNTDQFDDYVSAELPQKEKIPRLFDLVVKHMMHEPCGHLNSKNSCMIAGQCKSHYTRKFCERTVQGEDGYPIYRRRDDSQTVDVRIAKLNNQWVVPYNPYLLMRYDCHINVEICFGLTAVKYLYKYIYKGHDKVDVHIASGNEV